MINSAENMFPEHYRKTRLTYISKNVRRNTIWPIYILFIIYLLTRRRRRRLLPRMNRCRFCVNDLDLSQKLMFFLRLKRQWRD